MNNKHLSTILIIVSILALPAVFALAVMAQPGERVYLPSVYAISGTEPVHTPTPAPTPVPRHFNNCADQAELNATIGIMTDVLIDGSLVLEVDDEIAIFTPDGSICAGMRPWDGKNTAIAAWGDDSQTEEIDGLRGGEEMVFRIWDDSANKEIVVKNVSYSYGNGIYMPDGIYVVKSFTPE